MTTYHSGNMSLNSLLKIWQRGGVVSQLPNASELWKLVLKKGSEEFKGRQLNFEVLTSQGLGAIQGGTYGGSLPAADRVSISEYTAHAKIMEVTVIQDEELEARAKGDLSYAKPFMLELDAKKAGQAKVKSVEAAGDGTGVIGILSANPSVSTANGNATFTISATHANAGKSHIGWIMPGDKIKFATSAGVAHMTIDNTNDTVSYWRVNSVNMRANTFVATPYASGDTAIAIASATIGATDPNSGDYIYRLDTTPITAAPSDYNQANQTMAGLESLAASDGRVVHGITMSNQMAGSLLDCSAAVLDGEKFIDALSLALMNLGADDFKSMKYSNALMFNLTYDNLVKDGAANRQFVNVRDAETGVDSIGARYQKTAIEFIPDPYIQNQRVRILPNNPDCLEYVGSDFKELSGGALRNIDQATARHKKEMVRYFQSEGVLLSRRPSALISLVNFS